jgi:hypothetical protein
MVARDKGVRSKTRLNTHRYANRGHSSHSFHFNVRSWPIAGFQGGPGCCACLTPCSLRLFGSVAQESYRRLSAFICGSVLIFLGVLGELGGSIIDFDSLCALRVLCGLRFGFIGVYRRPSAARFLSFLASWRPWRFNFRL